MAQGNEAEADVVILDIVRTRTPSFIDDPQAERRDYKGTPSGDYPDVSAYDQEEGGGRARKHEVAAKDVGGMPSERYTILIGTSDRRTVSGKRRLS